MSVEYIRKQARFVNPGDRIFSVVTRCPIEVATVYVESMNKLVIEAVDGHTTAFSRKEFVLCVK